MRTVKTCILLLFISLFCVKLHAQSFLKSYASPFSATTPITFECITEKTDATGARYIAGHVRDTIMIFKTDNNGSLIAQYRIYKPKPNSRLDGIILDSRGDLVIIGNYENFGILSAFIFKYTPGNPTTTWFRETGATEGIAFSDIVEKPGANITYYVSGQSLQGGIARGLILKVNSANGALSNITPSHYRVNGVETATSLQLVGNIYHVAGRYAVGAGIGSFRSVYSRFNNGGHLGTKFYVKNNAVTDIARMYNNDMLVTGTEAVMVGGGDDNGTSTYTTFQVTKANSANGNIIWSRKYDLIGAVTDGVLCEIRNNPGGGYIVMGFLMNNTSQLLENAFLTSLDVNGNVLWSKSYGFTRRPPQVGANHQFNFTLDAKYIYAVGQVKNASGIAEGDLLKVELSNGNLINAATGATCDNNLSYINSVYTFAAPVNVIIDSVPYTAKNSVKNMQFYDFWIKDLCGGGCNLTVNAGSDVTTCCPSNGTQLNAVASGGTPPYTYSWSPAAGLNNPNIPNPFCTTTGTFTVTVTDANGVCIATDAVTITAGGVNCCRIAGGKNKSQAYPNPFNNGFILRMPANATADVEILNLYGMPLEVKRKASGTVQMGSKLAYGSYTLLVIYKDGTREELKIIKSPQ